jgi:hypothetical protein
MEEAIDEEMEKLERQKQGKRAFMQSTASSQSRRYSRQSLPFLNMFNDRFLIIIFLL